MRLSLPEQLPRPAGIVVANEIDAVSITLPVEQIPPPVLVPTKDLRDGIIGFGLVISFIVAGVWPSVPGWGVALFLLPLGLALGLLIPRLLERPAEAGLLLRGSRLYVKNSRHNISVLLNDVTQIGSDFHGPYLVLRDGSRAYIAPRQPDAVRAWAQAWVTAERARLVGSPEDVPEALQHLQDHSA